MGRTRESANLVSDKNIFVDIANDLVGIGTTAPTATLEVSGTLNVSGVSTFQGNVKLGDDVRLDMGNNNDLILYHQGTNSFILDQGAGNLILGSNGSKIRLVKDQGAEVLADFAINGSVDLYYDNSKKFETGQYGVIVTGSLSASNIDLEDDAKLLLGTGDDLQIYHDGSHSYIKDEGTGHLYIRTDGDRVNINGGSDSMAKFNKDGSVELYYDNSKKLETSGGGVTVTGIVTATEFKGKIGFSAINFVLS